jgi:hypothetical protein
MTRAFVVTLELLDGEDVSAVAADLLDLLSEEYKVIKVDPWASPTPVQAPAIATPYTHTTL